MYVELKEGSFHVEACIKMGKKKFVETHGHLEDPEKVFEEIEKQKPKK